MVSKKNYVEHSFSRRTAPLAGKPRLSGDRVVAEKNYVQHSFRGPLTKKLLRDLKEHKVALSALLAIIAVGIGVFTGTIGAYRGLDDARRRYYDRYRVCDFTVDMKRAPAWAVTEIAKLPNVRDVRGRVHLPTRVSLPHQRVDATVSMELPEGKEPISGVALSVPAGRTPITNDLLVKSGRWFSSVDAREVILNEDFAEKHALRPGDRIRLLLLDKEHDLLVVATAMSPEYVYVIPPAGGIAPDPARFAVLYLPEGFAQESCDLKGAFNQLVGRVRDTSRFAVRHTLRRIEERLDAYGVTNLTPSWEQSSVKFVSDEITGRRVSAMTTPVLFLGVAALVLNVLMSRLVQQQRSIIGTLRALGYSRGAITRHYLSFGVLIGEVGAVLGVALGWWLQVAVAGLDRQFYRIPGIEAQFYWSSVLLGVAVSVVFSTLGTLKGVRRAAMLEPAEAMRPPPPEKGARVLPERFRALWQALSFRWKMILRAVFRNPFRSTVSIVATVVSAALVLSTLALFDSLDYLIEFHFNRVAHEDYTVSLRDPEGWRANWEFARMPGITHVEPQLAVVCDLSNGPHEKRIGVTGVPPGSRLYTPVDENGLPVAVPSEGLVLDRKLADVLNVKPGDRLRLRPLIGQRREVVTPVVATVDSFLGLGAYADITYLSRLLGEDWSANVLLSAADRRAPPAPLMSELKSRPAVVGLGERHRSLTQIQNTFGEFMGTTLFIMILFAGLIAFGSVLNAAIVSLSERRREVGTLRVLGYTPFQVGGIFSGESYLLNVIGIALGLLGGVGLTHLLAMAYDTELYRFPVVIYASRLFYTVVMMLAFITVAQWIVHRMIRALPWLEVLSIKE